jgi:integrase
MGLPAALAAWERRKAERDAGGDPAAEKRAAAVEAKAEHYTVRRACADFLAAYKNQVAPKTYAEAERILTTDLVAIEGRVASSITRADAFDLIDGKSSHPVQAGRVRQLLGAVWDRALDAGRLEPDVPNWWRLVLRGKLKSKGKKVKGKHAGVAKRVLNEPELALLIPWMPNFSRDVADALILYLWTCCRGAEIVAMAAEEVSDEADGLWWTVPKAKLKMRRLPLLTDLRVPLVGRAEQIVRRRLAVHPQGFLFPSHGKSGHIAQKALGVATWSHSPGCKLRLEWARPRLPVADFSPHDLRRTSRTLLAAMGCPADLAEVVIGHLLPDDQGTYNRHHYDPERREWISALSARLEDIASGRQAM